MSICIWCGKENKDQAVEHIIPDALGCPPGFELKGGTVCESCNNKFGHIDQAVIDEFEILAFQAGVLRKKGRPPQVRSRGNMQASVTHDEKFMAFNMGKQPVIGPEGKSIAPYRGRERDIKATFERDGSIGSMSFNVEIGRSKKFRRGILKIALASLAYFLGPREARKSDYDSIRRFVKTGKGERPIFLMQAKDVEYTNQVWSPVKHETGGYLITLRLAFVLFLVDLTPDIRLFPVLKDQAQRLYGANGYTYLPTNA